MDQVEFTKPRRGRPQGSGLDDRQTLEKIADFLVRHPASIPTPAMRRVGVTDESAIRRLQRKWKADGAGYLKAARTRQAESRRPVVGGYGTGGGSAAVLSRLIAGLPPYSSDLKRLAAEITGESRALQTARRHLEAAMQPIQEKLDAINREQRPLLDTIEGLERQSRPALDAFARFQEAGETTDLGQALEEQRRDAEEAARPLLETMAELDRQLAPLEEKMRAAGLIPNSWPSRESGGHIY
ncbi:hypothetical protein [Thalassobaculum sp.]|uniref:hypothetical protein n=1 Tax=Thalassobaculum sp. TaxID=2022740 RepID=UPI0032EFD61D